MVAYELTEHARAMLKERDVPERWIRLALEGAENRERKADGAVHYIRPIA